MASPIRILVIDDDRELCDLLAEYLRTAGFVVEAAHDADEGVRLATSARHAAAILDVMLPGGDGFDVLRRVRAQSAIPVLMLTARGDEIDRIVGLEVGADDYLPKPFNPRELVARLRAILRRSRPDAIPGVPSRQLPIVVGELAVDSSARVVEFRRQPIQLTSTEFDLLETLVQSAGRVVSRDELSRSVLARIIHKGDQCRERSVATSRAASHCHRDCSERAPPPTP